MSYNPTAVAQMGIAAHSATRNAARTWSHPDLMSPGIVTDSALSPALLLQQAPMGSAGHLEAPPPGERSWSPLLEGASGSESHCCSPEKLVLEYVEYIQKNNHYDIVFK